MNPRPSLNAFRTCNSQGLSKERQNLLYHQEELNIDYILYPYLFRTTRSSSLLCLHRCLSIHSDGVPILSQAIAPFISLPLTAHWH
jgi:hypothetical protein